MLKFTSASGSVRAITDITLTGTIIRTGITLDLIMGPITGRTNFFERKLTEDIQPHETRRVYLSYFGEAAGLVTGPLPGSSIWNSFLNC